MPESRRIRNDILAVGLLAIIVFLAAALGTYDPADPIHQSESVLHKLYQPDQLVYPSNRRVTNACGHFGAWTADLLVHSLGFGAYYLVVGLIAMEIALFRHRGIDSPWLKTLGWGVSLLGLTTFVSLAFVTPNAGPLVGPGGYLGTLGKVLSTSHLGYWGGLILATSLSMVGLMMWTEYLVFRAGRVVFAPAFMAMAALLPFGLIHSFASWFNGNWQQRANLGWSRLRRANNGIAAVEDEEGLDENLESEIDSSLTLRYDGPENVLAMRTIKFRRRDLEVRDDEEEVATEEGAGYDSEAYEDEEIEYSLAEGEEGADDDDRYDKEDVESHDYQTIAEDPLIHSIGLDKSPDPMQLIEAENLASEVVAAVPIPKPHFKMKKVKDKPPTERDLVMNALNHADDTKELTHYELPRVEMLSRVESVPFDEQKQDAERNAIILEKTCKEFGYDVRVVEIEIGPVISQYEIELAPGLRLQKVVALADDIAIAMRVPSVRIVAPIPGKNSVGVEVPNKSRQIVGLRQLMEQSEKQIQKMKIPLFLGADAVGAPLVADLASLPHLLIAGRTGTGKSVCLNSIISSILMTRRPDEVRMLMIDPKMVELSGYARLPHLMHPVVTDMRKAEAILAWAVDKMEERYALLARAGVRHVTSYNQLGEEEIIERLGLDSEEDLAAVPTNLPFIVIIADEMADLMMTAGKEVEAHIIRLAQKSRAVGIHLILATQKPTVDVITGLIKSNLPARIAFQVASKTDSRVVLDEGGADKLLGMGDMLFLAPGTSTLLRGQGTYLSDEEIELITETVSTGEQDFVQELVNIKLKADDDDSSNETARSENRDKLYEEAVTLVIREQRGSTSMLQQKLQIGYGRAARLIDFMAEDGYLGPYNGSKAREVLLTEMQWSAIRNGSQSAPADGLGSAGAERGPKVSQFDSGGRPSSSSLFDDEHAENVPAAASDRKPTLKPHFKKKPLKALDKNTGLTSNLVANSPSGSTMPPIINKGGAQPTEEEFEEDDEEGLSVDQDDFDEDDRPLKFAAIGAAVDAKEDVDGHDDVENAADEYESEDEDYDYDEEDEGDDEDYDYEDDADYEDVEDED